MRLQWQMWWYRSNWLIKVLIRFIIPKSCLPIRYFTLFCHISKEFELVKELLVHLLWSFVLKTINLRTILFGVGSWFVRLYCTYRYTRLLQFTHCTAKSLKSTPDWFQNTGDLLPSNYIILLYSSVTSFLWLKTHSYLLGFIIFC